MNKPARPANDPAAIDPAAILARLAEPARLAQLEPVAARFVVSLRLIALHQRANRDPVPELAASLGGVEIAAKTLALSQAVASVWPETIHVSRFCCQRLTHDEATIGALVERACARDLAGFERQIEGFIRPERFHLLWDATLGLVAAERRAL